jgi:N-hydroxyarylamine O-acetyltransferase
MTIDVEHYFERIGYTGSTEPTTATLFALQRAHLLAVPFEALDCYLGVPIRLQADALFDKIVTRRRGGFCYELNGLFAQLLRALGFRISRLNARPINGHGLAPPFAHLALLVEVERRWLTDVGFGYFALAPLDVDERSPQTDGGHFFRVNPEGAGMVAEELGMPSRWGYWFTLEPHELAEYAEQCRIYSTDPASGFVRHASRRHSPMAGSRSPGRRDRRARWCAPGPPDRRRRGLAQDPARAPRRGGARQKGPISAG